MFFTSIANFWKSPLSPFRPAFSFFLVISDRRRLVLFQYHPTVSIINSGVIPMAEAVGLAASIGGLVGITSQVCKSCYNYYSEVMNAQADIQRFVSEISSLAGLLKPLSTPAQAIKILDSDPIWQLVQQCKEMLEKFQGEVELQRQPKKLSDRISQKFRMTSLKWPFKKEDTQKGIQQIERLKSTVALKLQM